MIKKISTLIFLSILLVGVSMGQSKRIAKEKPLVANEPNSITTNYTGVIGSPDGVSAENYILVDHMANAFGPGSFSINPLAYDPYSDAVAFIHRGATDYATGSGEMWYNISTDRGATWSRVASINSGSAQQVGRYPSMAISNPDKGDINSTTAAFSWAELDGGTGTFGWIGYGADQPLGAGAPFSDIIQDADRVYSSDAPTFTDDQSNWVYWYSRNTVDAAMTFFRTQDFATVERIDPPQWSDAVFGSGGEYIFGGVAYNGMLYVGVTGTLPDPDPNDPVPGGWYLGVSTSSDNGSTWSDFDVIDPRYIPGLEDFDELYDYKPDDVNIVSYCGDINVDANGYVHIATALTDTNAANNAVVDVYQTGSGWAGKVVANGLMSSSYPNGPGLGQMGPSPYFAFDSTRTVMACQWVNGLSETMPWCDAYFSYRTISGTDTVWSAPRNLTESDSINNTATHLAPMLATVDGNHFIAFSMYDYVDGATGPYSDTTATTNIYIAPVNFETTAVGVRNDLNVVNTFSLDQNYPNPFNPTTLIKYSVAERSNVSLKVYDVLGNEVTTLVNTSKDAGSYQVNFDASKLSSGVYIYTLNAGNYTQSKKMLLMK